MPLLELKDLEVSFGDTKILRGINLSIEEGETLGIVGESGCGKSMTGFAVMGMVPAPGKVTGGQILFEGKDLNLLRKRDWIDVRGSQIALVMQDPFTSLNPMMRVGHQIAEELVLHHKMSKDSAWKRSVELIDSVGVPSPEHSAKKFPHQMSGGQRQRIVIAMAFACRPKLLICDEPTTALDVTIQAQILRLIHELQQKEGTAVMLISHDIGVIGAISRRICVFYAGMVIESGLAEGVLRSPKHPYTKLLLSALPRVGQDRLESIAGQPPNFNSLPTGCCFEPRCPSKFDRCTAQPPLFQGSSSGEVACWLADSATNPVPKS